MIRQLNPLSKGVKLTKCAALCAGTAFVITSAMPANAAPVAADVILGLTASGTDVSNTVTLSFDVGGVPQTPVVSDPAVFAVDTMVDVLVVSAGDATVTPGETFATAVLSYSVTNEGNLAAGQGYALDIAYDTGLTSLFSAMTLSADATPGLGEYALFIDVNNDDLLDVGDTFYVAGGGANAFDLLPDQKDNVLVVAGIPLDADGGDTGTFTVVAQTLNVGTAVATLEEAAPTVSGTDVVFLDTVSDDLAYVGNDLLEDGFHSDIGTMTVSDAALTASKSVVVINDDASGLGCGADTVAQSGLLDQFAIVGACVEYTITVVQAGTAISTDVLLTDALPAGVTFEGIISSSSALLNRTSDDFYNSEAGDVAPANAGGTVTATEATFGVGQADLVLVIRASVN
jgi:uncharacterized repeat protein (TIGR01451 family)